jgi:hypothetical protein
MNEKCEHDILDENYFYQYQCETPYCTVTEEKCLQCGCIVVSCGCGYNNDVRED